MTAQTQDPRVSRIAERLRMEHRAKLPFTALAAEHLGDLAFAYDVQDEMVDAWRGAERKPVAGWKIGLTSARMREMCGVDSPIVGAILADRLRASPAMLAMADFGRLGLETELALRIGPAPFDPAAPMRSVDQVCAAFEIVDDRGADYSMLDACSIVADNGWNEGAVLGEPAAVLPDAVLTGLRGRFLIDGDEVDRGFTQDAGGDPIDILVWVEAMLRGRGRPLAPGMWILTGSIVRTRFAEAGRDYGFVIDGLPPVSLRVR